MMQRATDANEEDALQQLLLQLSTPYTRLLYARSGLNIVKYMYGT